MKIKALNILGWAGVILILLAYTVNVFGVLASGSFAYLFMNLLGSSFILFETFTRKDYQPAFLNLIWAIVALTMLVKILL